MDHQHRRKLEALISLLCDGRIAPEQMAELEQWLRKCAESRRLYLQYVDMHARLSMHPHLCSGIPLAADTTADDPVLSRAAEANRSSSGRSRPPIGRRVMLTLLALLAMITWGTRNHWWSDSRGPVVVEVMGEVKVESADGSVPAAISRVLQPGERLLTDGDESRAVLEYADGTRVVIYYDSGIEVPSSMSDGHLRLLSGTMEVEAAPQQPGNPLIFVTDHARYVVLGTRFRLYRESNASRLELDEGKVRLERQSDGESVDVTAGQAAVATSGVTRIDIRPLAEGTSELLATLKKAGEAVTFSDDGSLLATGDWQRGFRTWVPGETEPRDVWTGKPGRSHGIALAADGLAYVNLSGRQGLVTVWKPGDAEAVQIPLPGENARSRALSPEGQYVVVSANNSACVYAIDAASGSLTRFAELPDKGKAWCLAVTRNAASVAAGFWDGTVRIHDIVATTEPGGATAESIRYETRLSHTPTRIALSETCDRLAVFTRRDGLLLIDPATGHQQTLWAAGAAGVTCLKFTADGERLLAGLSDGTARMWSVEAGHMLLRVDIGHTPRDVAWSEATSTLVSANGEVRLWKCTIPEQQQAQR